MTNKFNIEYILFIFIFILAQKILNEIFNE